MMRERLLGTLAAFVALGTIASFTPNSLIVFGIGCALVGASVVLRLPILGAIGLFWMCLLSPYAIEYRSIGDEATLIGATFLVAVPIGFLIDTALSADEKRRFNWRIPKRAVVIGILVTVLIAHSVAILSLLGPVGTFLGNTEATIVQVLTLAFATSITAAVLLVPPEDRATTIHV